MLKKIMLGAATASLATAPALAQGPVANNPAASLSLAKAPALRAAAPRSKASKLSGGAAVATVLILGAVGALVGIAISDNTGDNNDRAVSR